MNKADSVEYTEISLFDIFRIIKKSRKLIIVLFTVTVLFVGIVTYFFIPKKYQSSTTIYLQDNRSSKALSAISSQLGALGGLLSGFDTGGASNDLCSEIIMAKQFLYEVLKEENLPCGPEDVEKFSDKVEVEKDSKTGVIKISVLWTDPDKAYILMKTIFKKYKNFMEQQIHVTNSMNRKFLEEQYSKSKVRLVVAEKALWEYQRKKGLPSSPEFVPSIEPEKSTNISNTTDSYVLQKYRMSLLEIQLKLDEARQKYTDEHPIVKGLLAQQDEILQKMDVENKVFADEMLNYQRLVREEKIAEQIFLLLTTQLEQAKLSEANENNVVIRVIDPPFVPYKKHSPSTVLNMAIAGFLALFIGVSYAFVREYIGTAQPLESRGMALRS